MSGNEIAVRARQAMDTPVGGPPPSEEPDHLRNLRDTVGVTALETYFAAISEASIGYTTAGLAARGASMSALAGMGAELMGALGWAISVGQCWHAMLSAPSEGRVRGLLDQAFGSVPTDSNYRDAQREATAIAVGAVLNGLDDEQIAALEQRWGSAAFRRGLDIANTLRAEHPGDFAEAQEIYREVHRNWQDGVAAALEGWYDESRDPVFKRAYASATSALRAGSPGAHAARRLAQQSKEQGFVDATRGQVDPERLERDGSYRSGVSFATRTLQERGPEAVQSELDRIQLRQRSRTEAARVPVQG